MNMLIKFSMNTILLDSATYRTHAPKCDMHYTSDATT